MVLQGVFQEEVILEVAYQGKVSHGVVWWVLHKEDMSQLVGDNTVHNNQDM